MERKKQLELRFRPIGEFGDERWRKFSGKYLTCTLCVAVEIPSWGQIGPFREFFILDTGSAATFIREDTFRKVLEIPFEDLELQEQEFSERITSEGVPERAKILPGVFFPQIGLKLPRAFLRSWGYPFGLLGTDFLEHFRMEFDPHKGYAILTFLEKR